MGLQTGFHFAIGHRELMMTLTGAPVVTVSMQVQEQSQTIRELEMVSLRELDTLGGFSSIFTRETTFDFFLAFLCAKTLLKNGLLLKEWICKFFSFIVNPFLEWRQTALT